MLCSSVARSFLINSSLPRVECNINIKLVSYPTQVPNFVFKNYSTGTNSEVKLSRNQSEAEIKMEAARKKFDGDFDTVNLIGENEPSKKEDPAGWLSERFFSYLYGTTSFKTKLGIGKIPLGPFSIPYPTITRKRVFQQPITHQFIDIEENSFGVNYKNINKMLNPTYVPHDYPNDPEFKAIYNAVEHSSELSLIQTAKAYKKLVEAYIKKDNIIQAFFTEERFRIELDRRLSNKHLALNFGTYWFNPFAFATNNPPALPAEAYVFNSRLELVNIKHEISIAIINAVDKELQKGNQLYDFLTLELVDMWRAKANIDVERNTFLAWIIAFQLHRSQGRDKILEYAEQFKDATTHPAGWALWDTPKKLLFYYKKFNFAQDRAADLTAQSAAISQNVKGTVAYRSIGDIMESLEHARKVSKQAIQDALDETKSGKSTPVPTSH